MALQINSMAHTQHVLQVYLLMEERAGDDALIENDAICANFGAPLGDPLECCAKEVL
jgi:hypothetical protein